MYTHCRQFPHLQGRSDQEIREVVRRAFARRPGLRAIVRARNLAVLVVLLGVFVAYRSAPPKQLGYALMIAGFGTTAFVLVWNVVWVNVVLYRLTALETSGESG
jgi:hypothetical protein